MTILYVLAAIALLVGTAGIYMALLKPFPVEWLYYHYFVRKPVVWAIFGGSAAWLAWLAANSGSLPLTSFVPLLLMALAIALTYRMHQSVAFPADDFPDMSDDPFQLPLSEGVQLAVIEYGGALKAYPLDYVIHHHIINDRFGDRTVSLTFCAMCRSIIPFDVTDIGPLFVGSFKDANMIVADRRTATFFQQATFESIIGPLHLRSLTMIPFQILPWCEVRALNPLPQVAHVTGEDFREFELPIPGVWKKIMASEATPGLPSRNRDKAFPARTHVIGVIDPIAKPQVAYLKRELIQKGVVKNKTLDAFFVPMGDTVNAFKGCVAGTPIQLIVNGGGTLLDTLSGSAWDARGKWKSGSMRADLTPVAISDEYWFSWKAFHPRSQLIRL